MPLPVYRLRRWLAATAIVFTALVAGMYFYARLRARNVLKEVPNKIAYDIKQTATGFQFSKSEGGRTLFTIQAADLKQFKLGDLAELHKVRITLYGRDSSRYDRISGDAFMYDPKSGDVTAEGDVQIDLEANPSGLTRPDQAAPQESKNPIHLQTRGLVFNRETGTARTDAQVEFQTPQASGSAVGARYAGRSNTLTLESQVRIAVAGPHACTIQAAYGLVTGDPRQIMLEKPALERANSKLQAEHATLFLTAENNVDRVVTSGNVTAEQAPAQTREDLRLLARADQAELFLTGKQSSIQSAILTGHVHAERTGPQPLQGEAERVTLDFSPRTQWKPSQLSKVHASESVQLTQHAAGDKSKANSTSQDFDLTAAAIDFFLSNGRRLDRALTSGAAQITIAPAQEQAASSRSPAQRTVINAKTFDAQFVPISDSESRLFTIHGAPDAKITSTAPGQPDRISTSQSVEARFLDQGGIQSITQEGRVAYADTAAPDKQTKAWAEHARYTPADQMLALSGSPRVVNAGMATTAQSIRINRATGDAVAENNVKTTYSELKEQPNGALLASSSPIHVSAQKMVAHNNGTVALYTGNARLWQDANVIEAPSIQFDRDHRSVTAQGSVAQPVSTLLVQPEQQQPAKAPEKRPRHELDANRAMPSTSSPISITGTRLTYTDAERKAHYEGGVAAKGADFTATATTLDAYLLPRSQASSHALEPGQLDRLVAQGNVIVQQPTRRAEGQTLTYLAADDKFILTGGPPSIFDAERGKITGVSLTFFRRDDRVLVEGEASTPVVTQTRVAP